MKKIICLILTIVMLFAVTACNDGNGGNGSGGGNDFGNIDPDNPIQTPIIDL